MAVEKWTTRIDTQVAGPFAVHRRGDLSTGGKCEPDYPARIRVFSAARIFHGLFGIGDTNKFDWGGIVGAAIGAMIVVVIASFLVKRSARRHAAEATARG